MLVFCCLGGWFLSALRYGFSGIEMLMLELSFNHYFSLGMELDSVLTINVEEYLW